MNFELTDDEFQTLKDIFDDWGSDCPYTDTNKRQALGEKFGILEPIPEPTPEELKRREEFKNSEFGLFISKMFSDCNSTMSKMAAEAMKDNAFVQGIQWPDEFGKEGAKIGSVLRIKLPRDYNIITDTKLDTGSR